MLVSGEKDELVDILCSQSIHFFDFISTDLQLGWFRLPR